MGGNGWITSGDQWGLPHFEVLLQLKGGVPGWNLGKRGLGQKKPQPSTLAPVAVGDLFESRNLDTTPASHFWHCCV